MPRSRSSFPSHPRLLSAVAIVAWAGSLTACQGDGATKGAASAKPAASASASPSATATSSAAPSATASAAAAPSASAAKTYDCGGKGQPNCPMQGWMKDNMGAAMASGDLAKIAKALDTVASKPIEGYDDWKSIATEGAKKARAGDLEGAKASCKKCHTAYSKRYKQERRDKPW